MKIYPVAEKVSLLDLEPAIPGFEQFIGCYVIRREKLALVDVGPSSCSQNLLQGLDELGVDPGDVEYIFITHIHIDHAGGIGKILPAMPRAKVVVHEKGKKYLVNPEKLWQGSKKVLGELADEYGMIYPVPEERILTPDDGEIFDLGEGIELEALLTPGHAPHHLSFLERGNKILFIGEAGGVYTLGKIRPSTPPPFNLGQMLSSIDKLVRLEPALLCYAHFGSATDSVNKLLSYGNQLNLWRRIILGSISNEESSDKIYHKLLSQDESCDYIVKSSFGERERGFLLNSIKGFSQHLREVTNKR